MVTNICTTVFFCVVVICISVCYVQKLRMKNDEEIFKVKSLLKNEIEFEKHLKEFYKKFSCETNLDIIKNDVCEIQRLLNEYVIKDQKENDK